MDTGTNSYETNPRVAAMRSEDDRDAARAEAYESVLSDSRVQDIVDMENPQIGADLAKLIHLARCRRARNGGRSAISEELKEILNAIGRIDAELVRIAGARDE